MGWVGEEITNSIKENYSEEMRNILKYKGGSTEEGEVNPTGALRSGDALKQNFEGCI